MPEEHTNDYKLFAKVKALFKEQLNLNINSPIRVGSANKIDFQWVQDKYHIIGSGYIHYELYCEEAHIYIDLHLENKKNKITLLEQLYTYLLEKNYNKEFIIWHNWPKKTEPKPNYKSIRYYKKFSLADENIASVEQVNKMIQSFIELDKIIGNDIRDFLCQKHQVDKNIIQQYTMAKDMTQSLNRILYGPSGTGKTYKLQHSFYKFFEADSKKISKQEFEFQIVSKLSWWQVCALVLLDSPKLTVPEIKKHRFLTYKLAVSNTNNLNQTLWGQLSAHTVKHSETVEYSKRTEPLIFNKLKDSIWEIENEKQGLISDLVELYNEISSYKEITISSKNYKFITFHQSFNYEDFVEGIKPTINSEQTDEIPEVTYSIVKGVLYNCCDEAAKLAGFLSLKDSINNYSKEERAIKYKHATPYALFIDEINRGNISQIFGELITLIEDTKRLGNDEIIVELPYSKNNFGVPSNLYIIGTMNTADRSVEALDTALRRRFIFEEMPPKYDLEGLQQKLYNFTAAEILQTINKRIEKLLDRDHLIGHAYLINKDETTLINSFYNNIIPLLQEYFFGDYGKIGLILGSGFIKTVDNDSVFANFESLNYSQFEDRESYEIINHQGNSAAFNHAIQLLMNK